MSTKIEWADKVWNPVTGCSKISIGCANCYAESMAKRFWGNRKFNDVRCHEDRLAIPLKWKKPRRVFICSMGDLFHEDVPADFIVNVFEVMCACPQHTFLVLTKRPERLSPVLYGEEGHFYLGGGDYLPNVHLGVSIENQRTADERIPILLDIPASVRFISIEPMLEAIDLSPIYMDRHRYFETGTLDWVICGCESGNNRRECKIEWIRNLRDQCIVPGVPFFLKQMEVDGKVVKMPKLMDIVWNQLPGGE